MRKKKKLALESYQRNQDAQLAFERNVFISKLRVEELARMQAAAGDRVEPSRHDRKWAEARIQKARKVVGLWLRR